MCKIQNSKSSLLHRAYITPSKFNKMDNSLSHLCWHGCSETGTLIHLMWQCPAVKSFWKEVISRLSSILIVKIPLCPLICLLGSKVDNIQSTRIQCIIALAFLSVKCHRSGVEC
uniref:Reverse transcriptase zinc-binding domain-containing protein n=1 Tax=Sander lucioperca TaxID=283035 RepID=A0A8C9YFL0_SANLU